MVYYDMYGNPMVMPAPNNVAVGAQQPQMNFQPQVNCQCDNRFMWVPSKEVARTTPMAPDKTILFLDENVPYQYLRRTDKEGKTVEFRIFKLDEEKEPEPIAVQPTGNVVTKDEFDKFTNDINGSIQNLMQSMLDLQNSMNKSYNKPYNQKKGQVNSNG